MRKYLCLLLFFPSCLIAGKPNILWLTSEDNNISWVGSYGNPHADTPHIDALAKEGFQYMHCYANAPVCAPMRSTWITGVNAVSMGTQPMRSRNVIPHDRIQYYPDHLKANGYFVGNSKKTDYNIGGREDKDCWDNPGQVDWDSLKNNQPFFQVINSVPSHESRAQGDVEDTLHDPADTQLRAYHPDLPDVRKNYAKYHDAVKRMDAEIGASLKKLEEMGLSDDTIVIYNSDHGGVLPRSKRYLFSSGIHCPLIVRIPEKFKDLWPADSPGDSVERIVSFVDMPKTWLSLTGTTIPDTMQGRIFLGHNSEEEPEFHYAYRGRMDERSEKARAVYDKQYVYIRNYMPYVQWMQHLDYLWKMKATVAWEQHVQSGKANEIQSRFFAPKTVTEELYDNLADPDNVHNLAASPEHAQRLEKMRAALKSWQREIHDSGLLPESEMVKRAADNGLTIYDMVRDPALYDLPALQAAADLALEIDSGNLPALRALLKSPDSGIRYWGAVGCFLLNDVPSAEACLDDASHEVRAMAAWALIRNGQPEAGFASLMDMLQSDSIATLKILNILDWIGDDARQTISKIESTSGGRYESALLAYLKSKYNG